jgi:hypothetical protein
MDKRLTRLGFGLLIPASLIFGVRALLLVVGSSRTIPGFAFALAGILSGLGMIALLFGYIRTKHFTQVAVAAIVAFSGHWLVKPLLSDDLGAAMVYLGTGFVASIRTPWAAGMGATAGLGAILRSQPQLGAFPNVLIAVGALGIAAALYRNLD